MQNMQPISISGYEKQQAKLEIMEKLTEAKNDIKNGGKYITLKELKERLDYSGET